MICEKAGLRRVLMNIFGNSLKFTSDGFIHVALRESPHGGDTPPQNRRVELSVLDTGKVRVYRFLSLIYLISSKGISQDFLKVRNKYISQDKDLIPFCRTDYSILFRKRILCKLERD